MKRLFIILVFAILCFGQVTTADAQCKQQLVYQCASQTEKAIYLRDFNTKLKREKDVDETGMKWTVVLNKGTQYKFSLCTPDGFQDQVVLTLYDSEHPENSKPWGSTFDNSTKTDRKSFDFLCNKTAMYYVSIRLKPGVGDKKSCAVGVLSFVGKSR
ncbi:MAG: hypothetical protein MJ211_10660 [Bacteroidales bacterium]|nr:hypothetical protein [Bacteroidales bacterium]